MKTFFKLDRKPQNGQVEWDEWYSDFLAKFSKGQKKSRVFKEKVAAAKASWYEAARSHPEKLNIDEFLAFTHPEFSHPLLLLEAEGLLNYLDGNNDELVSVEEYTKHTRANEMESRRELFWRADHDSDGALTKQELLSTVDPMNKVWMQQKINGIFRASDSNQDGFIDIQEFDENVILQYFPEQMFHKIF